MITEYSNTVRIIKKSTDPTNHLPATTVQHDRPSIQDGMVSTLSSTSLALASTQIQQQYRIAIASDVAVTCASSYTILDVTVAA